MHTKSHYKSVKFILGECICWIFFGVLENFTVCVFIAFMFVNTFPQPHQWRKPSFTVCQHFYHSHINEGSHLLQFVNTFTTATLMKEAIFYSLSTLLPQPHQWRKPSFSVCQHFYHTHINEGSHLFQFVNTFTTPTSMKEAIFYSLSTLLPQSYQRRKPSFSVYQHF